MNDDTVRDEIVVLMRSGDGYFDHDRLSLKRLKNVVPCIGDRLTLHLEDEGLAVYQVENRYLVDLRPDDEDCGFWVLIVDQIHEDHFYKLDEAVRRIHREGFQVVWLSEPLEVGPIDTAETLDRSNRDPSYWTFERKEILRKEREGANCRDKR
ncbi:hypothetical protein D3227_25815 [Mesorhizobium waimense]|uniref:Uncharacterized protein n=1 Tax=Mesorhizobium waimense TaxID=1300307 RepID=A0A3A5KAZ4_9HYPH|nr:hypothetical protein [Mesorhizobium waimense]RJT32817.1 hypothetical protein D3227_25815 [Mesorhizobium waimense]